MLPLHRLRNDRAEELRLESELQLLRQQLDEVVQEKEHRFDIFVYDGYYQRFSHGLTVHATSNHSDSHLAVIEKASGTFPTPNYCIDKFFLTYEPTGT